MSSRSLRDLPSLRSLRGLRSSRDLRSSCGLRSLRSLPAVAAALAVLVALALLLPSTAWGDRSQVVPAQVSAPVAGPGLCESDSGYLTYGGQWSADTAASQASGGEARYSNAAGSSVTLEFEGDGITWITSRGPAEGVAYVWIDGGYWPEVDLYHQGTRLWQVPIRYVVSPGRHQIRVEVSGARNGNSSGYNVTVDAFLVESGTSLQTPTPTPIPTATATPTATTTLVAAVRVEAHVAFQRPPGHPIPQLPLQLWVCDAGSAGPLSSAALFSAVAITQADGAALFDLGTVPPGRYDLYAKGDHTLSRLAAGASLVSGDTRVDFGLLPEGDITGDDMVGDADFSLLERAFGRQSWEEGYLAAADLNGDGVVDIADFSLLAGNYGLDGAARAAMR